MYVDCWQLAAVFTNVFVAMNQARSWQACSVQVGGKHLRLEIAPHPAAISELQCSKWSVTQPSTCPESWTRIKLAAGSNLARFVIVSRQYSGSARLRVGRGSQTRKALADDSN